MLDAISYFNPLANKQTFHDFKQMATWQKVGTAVLTCLGVIVAISLNRRASCIPRYVSFPATSLCVWATFKALVALATSKNIPTEKKTDELKNIPPALITPPIAPVKEKTDELKNIPPALVTPPIAPIKEKTGLEIQKEQCAALIQKKLGPNEYMGTAIDNGDCFYDAIAQLLIKEGPATVQSLRKDIKEALKDPAWEAHLKAKLKENPVGLGSFEDYVQNVSPISGAESRDPLWGDASREGVILCKKYGFNLRVLGAGLLVGAIKGDKKLKDLKENHHKRLRDFEGEDNTKMKETYKKDVKAIRRELYKDPDFYFVSEDIYPKNHRYQKTLTIALFSNHFVPVLTR